MLKASHNNKSSPDVHSLHRLVNIIPIIKRAFHPGGNEPNTRSTGIIQENEVNGGLVTKQNPTAVKSQPIAGARDDDAESSRGLMEWMRTQPIGMRQLAMHDRVRLKIAGELNPLFMSLL